MYIVDNLVPAVETVIFLRPRIGICEIVEQMVLGELGRNIRLTKYECAYHSLQTSPDN